MNLLKLLPAAALLLAACGGDEPPPPPKPAPQGRAETQSIRNTDAVGTGGKVMANKIDAALDKQEEAARKLKEQSDQQSSDSN